jgi:fibro-slime domain-containing protein
MHELVPRRLLPRRSSRMAMVCAIASTVAALGLLACGSSSGGAISSGTGGGVDGGVGGDSGSLAVEASVGCLTCNDDDGSAGDGGSATWTPPANFVPTNLGGYALGPSLLDGGAGAMVPSNDGSHCSVVVGVVRDFKYLNDPGGGHPDFGTFHGNAPTTGLMLTPIGSSSKPAYAGHCDTGNPDLSNGAECPYGQQLTTQANFTQWYSYAAGVNLPYLVYLQFVPNGSVYTFEADGSIGYFPLDDAGWGNNYDNHNFGFTTELHLTFQYKGGETFTFDGDDDVWVYIGGKLVVDLGGTHPSATGSVQLDSLGLQPGSQYPLDIFNAERQVNQSDFRVDTDLAFTSCGTVGPSQ